ncbi:MAG: ABC transporter permease [Eubacteriales bacterium]
MLFRKLWRTMGLYKAQFISMMIMISLGIGIFIGFNMEWVSVEKNTDSFLEATSFADYRMISEGGFSEEDAKIISELDGVDRAARYLSVQADVKEKSGDTLALTVTENADVSGFLIMSGEAYDEKSADGIWLSDRYAAVNGLTLGDSLTLVYKNIEFKGIVKGIIKSGEHMVCVRDETQLMPDFETHGFAYISPVMYKETAGLEFNPQINVLSDLDKKEFTDKVDKAFNTTMMILTRDENISYAGPQGEIEEGKTMGTVLPVLFLLIAVLTMVTTMHRLTAKEKTQIGTLKALGFKDKRILCHYTSYAFMIGLMGMLIGIALGYLIGWLILNPDGMMATYIDIPQWKMYLPWFCIVTMAAILILLTLIGFLSVRQMLKGTAADALRPYAPKKMKKFLLEKTALWEKLGFGTRWNLRDSMRHKSRTLMSLIGVVGCAVIIVAALGMGDTMDAFLDMYYDDAIRYSSRINLSEQTTKEQTDELIEKYNGDYSASVAVQIEEKAVSLDVYHTPGDLVRFPDENNRFVEIKDDGVYLCMRLAEEFDLSEGDTFTVSPYGSDETYTLKVAGMIRSVSENMVISPEYADTLGLLYTVNAIYTQTVKADITPDSSIAGVQSKQSIVDSFDSFLELMNLMILILIIAAVVLGVVVLYNLGVMSYTERYREMATLKVVGFKDQKIGVLLTGQNLWISLIGVVIGIPLGATVLDYLIHALASEYEMKTVIDLFTYLVSILLTVGMSLIVSLMVAGKNRKINMVEALKGAE